MEPLMAMAERSVVDRLVATPYLIALEEGSGGCGAATSRNVSAPRAPQFAWIWANRLRRLA